MPLGSHWSLVVGSRIAKPRTKLNLAREGRAVCSVAGAGTVGWAMCGCVINRGRVERTFKVEEQTNGSLGIGCVEEGDEGTHCVHECWVEWEGGAALPPAVGRQPASPLSRADPALPP